MKAEHVKGIAKEIFSDGKHAERESDNDDDMGDVETMHIEPAGNGYMVSTHHKSKPSKNGELASRSPSKHVFTNHGDVAAHVSKVFGKGK